MKKIYSKLPVPLQDLGLTVVNNYKYFLKYGAIPFINPLHRVIRSLDISAFNDGGTLARINALIDYAVNHVPYYKRHKTIYKPIQAISELAHLPILTKEIFKKFNNDFISDQAGRFNSYRFRTSGSTGTPITGAIKNSELRMRSRMFLTSLKMAGIDYSRPVARFPGADVASKAKVYRRDFINDHLLFSIYHLSHDQIQSYHNALTVHKIEILEGYPSTILSLVRLLKANHLKLPKIKHVLTTAEKLQGYQKKEIEDFFGIAIFDFYGSSEGSAYMFSYTDGNYLNCNRIAFFECVDENGQAVLLNNSGRMLVTSFTSSFTPLIRYDIGDYATLTSHEGEVLKVSEIEGRKEDIFITPEGKAFGRFSLVLKYLPTQVLESQLSLTQGENSAILEYVANEVLPSALFEVFEQKMDALLDMEFIYHYRRVPKFKKSKRGKLSAVRINKDVSKR